jgi:Ca2+-binding RTX toxin-like protein
MAWKFPLSTNTAISLATTDNIYVAEGILIGTPGTAISGSGTAHIVEVHGTVIAESDTIVVGDLVSNGTTSVHIGATGHVISTYENSNGASALVLRGGGGTIINDGEIRSTGYGVFINAINTTEANTVVNNGTISGVSGVLSRGGDTIVLNLINNGTITGSDKAFGNVPGQNSITSSKDIITNFGLIEGDIHLTGGDDTYNGLKGTLKGSVFGGDGADSAAGGAENNVLDGGAGTDRLRGGLGADTLTGGTEADTFIFRLAAESTVKLTGRDTIIDFDSSQADQIDLHSIDANVLKKGNQAFEFIGSEAFDDRAGQLRFKASGLDTVVYGDVNGDGKADFAVTLKGVSTLEVGDFLL